jgi:hypothetical protein
LVLVLPEFINLIANILQLSDGATRRLLRRHTKIVSLEIYLIIPAVTNGLLTYRYISDK